MTEQRNLPTEKRARPSGLGFSIGLAILLVGLVALVVIGGQRLLSLANGQSEIAPLSPNAAELTQQLAERQAREQTQLNEYGWVDQNTGIARIPIARAMALVAAQGLPVGIPPTATPDAAAQTESSAPLTTTEQAVDLTNIDFQTDILPIFMNRCSECHGDDNPEEGLELTSYAKVMAGSIYGRVVKPGDPDGSYLVEMIATGKMPKRGDPVTPTELAMIIAWIKAGALDDSTVTTTETVVVTATVGATQAITSTKLATPTATAAATEIATKIAIPTNIATQTVLAMTATVSATAAITSTKPVATAIPTVVTTVTPESIATRTVSATVQSNQPRVTITGTPAITATETTTETGVISSTSAISTTVDLTNVSFKNDVLPIFTQHCFKCHSDDQPEEGLELTSRKKVMAGSINGGVVKPGDPENSYLVKMISEGKMPKRGELLTQDEIAIIIAWIKAGAVDN